MGRHIPSTSMLLAFEAVARHGSITRAAQELVVTEGAVSRQVSRLESSLGTSLFVRAGRRMELTEQGAVYADQVGRVLLGLERSTVHVMTSSPQQHVLEIAAAGTLATHWLIPRLSRFREMHPDVVVNLGVRNEPFVMSGSGFDAAIAFQHPAWGQSKAQSLFASPLIPVGAADLVCVAESAETKAIADLPLLHKSATPESWAAYGQATGLDLSGALMAGRFEQFAMLIEAARAGLGVALVPALYVTEQLRDGTLVAAGSAGQVPSKEFIFVPDPAGLHHATLDVFRRWLVDEAMSTSGGVVPLSQSTLASE